jgi:hypothetical protein
MSPEHNRNAAFFSTFPRLVASPAGRRWQVGHSKPVQHGEPSEQLQIALEPFKGLRNSGSNRLIGSRGRGLRYLWRMF